MSEARNDLVPSTTPGPGHNLSFISLGADGRVALIPEQMREYLSEEILALTNRRDELLGSFGRAPATVADEETNNRMADLVKLMSACVKNAETDRVARKEPFLSGERIVDAVFKAVTDPLLKAKTQIESRMTAFQRIKEAEERRRREEIARQEREEADRKRRAAEEAERAAQTEAELNTAIAAQAAAEQQEADATVATRAAEVKPAELSRSRSDYGAVSSLRQFWDFRELDRGALDLDELRSHLPLAALEIAVRSYIKAGGRSLRGVEIFHNTAVSVR